MLPREAYFAAVKRPYPPLYSSLIQHGWSQYEYYAPFGLGKPWAMRHAVMTPDFMWHFSKADVARGGELVLKAWMNEVHFRRGVALLRERERTLREAVGQDFAAFAAAYKRYMPAVTFAWAPEKLVTERLTALLIMQLSAPDTNELIGQLNTPLEDNLYKQEEYELAQTDELSAHVQKYEWLNSRYGADVRYTAQEAAARKTKLNADELEARRAHEKASVRAAIARAKELLGEDAQLVDIMQFIIYYRTHRTDVMNMVAYQYIPQLKQMAAQRHLTYEQLLHCMAQEILEDTVPSLDIINERRRRHAIVMEEGLVRCLIERACDEIETYFNEDVGYVTEVRGTVACQGKARGTARVIAAPADFAKVKVGDILVTSMTTPNMISIMKRAAAFVTDEGGITCHAAIISREMGKPCIIGTRIATKVLRDGNWVEVDAEKGVVRLVPRVL